MGATSERVVVTSGRVVYDAFGRVVKVYHPTVDGEGNRYYYHSDHLGSSMLITDESGNVTQQLDYLPYGEVFLEKRKQDPDVDYFTPYKFNGKELDEETGLYYYGARYMNPRLSIWYGTDPLQEKYPNISSYAYCADNPIYYLDPNGDSIQIRVWDYSAKMLISYSYDLSSASFKDSNGNIYNGSDINAKKTLAALNTLSSKESGKELVSALSSSSDNVVIVPKTSVNNGEGEGSQGFASYVNWNPDADAYAGGGSFIALGHELAHSLDRINGTMDLSRWYTIESEGSRIDVPKAEIFSTHYENRIRAEHNVPLRTHYSFDSYDGIIRPTGGQIIKDKNISIYFDQNGQHLPKYKKIKNNNFKY